MNTVTKKIQQKMNYSIFNLLEDEMLKEELNIGINHSVIGWTHDL